MTDPFKSINEEVRTFQIAPPQNISAHPTSLYENPHLWTATITGPPNSPYSGGKFKLSLLLPPDYPSSAPEIKFETKIFHPNVNARGQIGMGTRMGELTSFRVSQVLVVVYEVLILPEVEDAVDCGAAGLYEGDLEGFERVAREWTGKFARG
ncbi:hypothetical protein EG328_001231 [Venturia inaequalis]|uniref:UBC core domain-containing protein n=1 Tax=Venturia inaequalis TaxID=5025 RepID=A0A8H3U2N9_VENIN|nr:hypothetical protein EG328_001231 [Venturia inaequalis]KAE9993689.1 hypothetical protein EG327_003698 [Venturia inaequalis]